MLLQPKEQVSCFVVFNKGVAPLFSGVRVLFNAENKDRLDRLETQFHGRRTLFSVDGYLVGLIDARRFAGTGIPDVDPTEGSAQRRGELGGTVRGVGED